MSDTPLTDILLITWDMKPPNNVMIDHSKSIELEMNRFIEMFRKLNLHALDLTDRIRRLEEVGDAMHYELTLVDGTPTPASMFWNKAKEDKP